MNTVNRFRHLLALGALLLASGAGSDAVLRAQQSAASSAAAAVVKARTYVSLDPVPRGSEFQVAVAIEIASGFHMNSHKPLDSYLIPTTLTPQLPAGFTLTETVYPNGRNEKFPFSPDKPLNVYSGSVTLRLRLSAQASAPIGATTIPITLRYQACNNSACLPPVKIPVNAQIQVSAAGTKGRALHPEIFSAASPTQK
jgi:DsbC/DsbD-like thiol-disulfide interchange protein